MEFNLPKAEEIQLEIFNVLGERVKSLALGYYTAGTHSVSWDGTDDTGLTVASGVYLVHFSGLGSQQTATRKIVLMK